MENGDLKGGTIKASVIDLETEAKRLASECVRLEEKCINLTQLNVDSERTAAKMVQLMGDQLKEEVNSNIF